MFLLRSGTVSPYIPPSMILFVVHLSKENQIEGRNLFFRINTIIDSRNQYLSATVPLEHCGSEKSHANWFVPVRLNILFQPNKIFLTSPYDSPGVSSRRAHRPAIYLDDIFWSHMSQHRDILNCCYATHRSFMTYSKIEHSVS